MHNHIRKRSIIEYCKYPKRLAFAIVAFFVMMAFLLAVVVYV